MSIRVAVDATNAGQFFACCGLLELANRLWPDAEGWFTQGEFHVTCAGDLNTLLAILVMDPPEQLLTLDNGLTVGELLAPLRFSFDGGATTALTLDAWAQIRIVKGRPAVDRNAPWNFWSGQQTSFGIWCALREALARQLVYLKPHEFGDLFSKRFFQKGRFGFDPGPAWNALDVGFSLNEHNMDVESSAAVELLAAVGLQRFRPVVSRDLGSFLYSTWCDPLTPAIAAAVMGGAIATASSVQYRGSVVSRGQYGALGYSYPVRGGESNE